VSWDYNGNLTARQDLKQELTETFVYDALNRLDFSQRNRVTNLDVTLDAIGNVTWRCTVVTAPDACWPARRAAAFSGISDTRIE
jgi:hypothetical protein